MSDLEDALKQAIRYGLLSFTVNQRWDGKSWDVTYRNADNTQIAQASDPDPVEALKKAFRAGMKQSSGAYSRSATRNISSTSEPPATPQRRKLI